MQYSEKDILEAWDECKVVCKKLDITYLKFRYLINQIAHPFEGVDFKKAEKSLKKLIRKIESNNAS